MVSSSCPAPPSPPCALLWRGALPPMEPHSLDIQGGCVLCARIALQAATCAFFGRGWGARILRPCTAVNANVTTIRLAGGAASRLAAPQDPLAARPALQCGPAGAPSPLAHSWASACRAAAAPRVCALRTAELRGCGVAHPGGRSDHHPGRDPVAPGPQAAISAPGPCVFAATFCAHKPRVYDRGSCLACMLRVTGDWKGGGGRAGAGRARRRAVVCPA